MGVIFAHDEQNKPEKDKRQVQADHNLGSNYINANTMANQLSPTNIIALQRTLGNRATTRIVHAQHASVQRDLDDDMEQQAAQAREASRQTTPPAMQISNVRDVSSATRLRNEIQGYNSNMEAGAEDGNITGDQLNANANTLAALNDYLFLLGEQTRTLSDFQREVGSVRTNYASLNARIDALQATGRVDAEEAQTANNMGTQVVQSAGFMNESSMQTSINDNPMLVIMRDNVRNMRTQMTDAQRALGERAEEARGATFGVQSAADSLKQQIQPATPDPALTAQLNEVRGRVDTFKSWVGQGLSAARTAMAATPAGAAVSAIPGSSAVGDAAQGGLLDLMTESIWGAQIRGIQALIEQKQNEHVIATNGVNTNNLRQAQSNLAGALRALQNARQAYSEKEADFQRVLSQFGEQADRATGRTSSFTLVTQVLSDVQTLMTRIDSAIQLGETEQRNDELVAGREGSLRGSQAEDRDAMIYYRPYLTYHNQQTTYMAVQNHVVLVVDDQPGSATGEQHGINPVVDRSMEELRQFKRHLEQMRSQLNSGLGL